MKTLSRLTGTTSKTANVIVLIILGFVIYTLSSLVIYTLTNPGVIDIASF